MGKKPAKRVAKPALKLARQEDTGLLALPGDLLLDIAARVPAFWRRNLRLAHRHLRTAGLKQVLALRLLPEHLPIAGQQRLSSPTTFPAITSLTVATPPLAIFDCEAESTSAEAWALLAARHLPSWSTSLTHLDLGGLRLSPEELHATLQAAPALLSLSPPDLQIPAVPAGRASSSARLAGGHSPAAVLALDSIAALTRLTRLDLSLWQPHHDALLLFAHVASRLTSLQELSVRTAENPPRDKMPQAVVDSLACCAALRKVTYEGPHVQWSILANLQHLSGLVLRVGDADCGNLVLQAALRLLQVQHLSVTADFLADYPLLPHGNDGAAHPLQLDQHSLTELHVHSWPRGGAHRAPKDPATLRLADLQALVACPHLHTLAAPSVKPYSGADPSAAAAAAAALWPLSALRTLTVGGGGAAGRGGSLFWAGSLSGVFPALTSLTAALPVFHECRLGTALQQSLVHLDLKDTVKDGSPDQAFYNAFSLHAPQPALRSLTLRGCAGVSLNFLLTVAWRHPLLQSLRLTFARAMSDAAAEQLVGLLPHLRQVDLKECPDLTPAGVRTLAEAPSMRRLVVRRCRHVRRTDLVALLALWPDLDVGWEGHV